MTTITPTEERVRLRLRRERGDAKHITKVVGRWLERSATRKGRHINEPSLAVQFEDDPVRREGVIFACADSFPDTMPDWLRRVKIDKSSYSLENF